jgi:predicted glycosyltransferase
MGNKTSFFFASKILIPENFKLKKKCFFNYTYKTKYYPGLKEGIYLWLKNNLKAENNENKEFTIFIRPEPQTAQYYKGKINFLDELITDLQSNFKIIVLCRNNLQLLHYQQEKFSRITVPNEPIDFDEIIKDCNLFIGAGGSMTREAAILGIPTISVYQDTLLKVDEYLIENKMMLHEPYLTSNKVVNAIEQLRTNPPSIELINKGKKAYELLKSEILQYNTI